VLNSELRPLGAGEVLDRAVTLFVRRFVPLAVVLAVSVVPLMILEAVIAPGTANIYSDMARVFTASGRAESNAAAAQVTRDQGSMAAMSVVVLLTYALRFLTWSAILTIVAAPAAIGVGAAYRAGLRYWFAQVVAAIAFMILGMLALIPAFVLYVLAIVVVAALAALHALTVAVIVGILAGVVVLALFAAVGSWVYMTYAVATTAIAIERVGLVASITLALRRTLSRATWWRAIIAGLIIGLLTGGGELLFVAAGAVVGALAHVPVLMFAFAGVGQILVQGLLAAFVVVFATDMRVRREGFDLSSLAEGAT
jgi:hypothetical protein